jgi:hypothetical protein
MGAAAAGTQVATPLEAVVALALILFPAWNAVHPMDGLTVGLGHAWILEAFFIRAEKEIPCE